MAEQSDMKEVKRVLVGPLIANNPIALQVLGAAFGLGAFVSRFIFQRGLSRET